MAAHIPPFVKRVHSHGTITAGSSHVVKLGNLPRHLGGRPLHVASITLRATLQWDEAGAGVNPYPGEYLNAAIQNLSLRTGDHYWVRNMDGDEINELTRLYVGQNLVAIPSDEDFSGAAANNQTASIQVRIQCTPHNGPAGAEFDGAIPVALLDDTRGGELRFEVASGLPGDSTITVDHITSLTVDVELVALDHLRGALTAWRMRAYDESQAKMRIQTEGRVQTVAIRNRVDASGSAEAPDHSGFDTLSLTIGDHILYSGRSSSDVANFYSHRLPAAVSGNLSLTQSAPEILPIYVSPPGQKRSKKPSGPFLFEAETRNDSQASAYSTVRVLVHEHGRSNNASKMHSFLAMLGAPPLAGDPTRTSATLQARFANGDGRSSKHPVSDILDMAAYWPGMSREGYSVPERKLARKLARL